jgi:hypothetical protein
MAGARWSSTVFMSLRGHVSNYLCEKKGKVLGISSAVAGWAREVGNG